MKKKPLNVSIAATNVWRAAESAYHEKPILPDQNEPKLLPPPKRTFLYHWRTRLLKTSVTISLASGLGWVGGQAASFTNDFNTDPSAVLNFGGTLWDGSTSSHTGSAHWVKDGGAGPAGTTASGPTSGKTGDGFLSITFASPDCSGTLSSYLCGGVLFDDFDKGMTVAGFTFECDLRIGNGNPNPADGFSINYVRNSDPVLKALAAGDAFPDMNNQVSPNGGQFSDNGNGGDVSLMEEGCQTGLSIGFDMWDSGAYSVPPTGSGVGVQAPGLVHDGIGLDIRVDNQLITTIPMPNGTTQPTFDSNGNPLTSTDTNGTNAATDPTAIETGPYDGSGCDTNLMWVHFKVSLSTNGVLNVFYKNKQILTNLPTKYFPSPGRLLMASRVGGNTANIEVDNVQITTIAASKPSLVIGSASSTMTGVSVVVFDAPPAVADTNTIALKLNGTAVTPTSVVSTNGQTTIAYDSGKMFASGATNTVSLSISDKQSPPNTVTADRIAVAPLYVTLPNSLALTASQVDATKPGFIWDMYQVTNTAPDPQNTTQTTFDELAGKLGPNIADPNAQGIAAAPGTVTSSNAPIHFEIPTSIQVDRNGATWGTWAGNQMPGSPGTDGTTDNQAARIITYVDLPAGLVHMGINSDDGFATYVGDYTNTNSLIKVGEYLGGKAASDVPFDFLVNQAGIYPFVTYWENGGGDSRIAWFTVGTNGTQVALNDTANGGLKTYRIATVTGGGGGTGTNANLTATPASGGNITIQWTGGGTLQSGTSVLGPWTDMAAKTSPATVPTTGQIGFFRIKQ